ncbi:hypothetical protein ABZP36_034678 [Zizania latifolia]
MAAVGVTSPPPPAAVAAAVSTSSHRCRIRLPRGRSSTAASFRAAQCAAAALEDAAAAAVAEAVEGDPDAGTDVAGGAATSTRPRYSLISAASVQKAMRGLGEHFLNLETSVTSSSLASSSISTASTRAPPSPSSTAPGRHPLVVGTPDPATRPKAAVPRRGSWGPKNHAGILASPKVIKPTMLNFDERTPVKERPTMAVPSPARSTASVRKSSSVLPRMTRSKSFIADRASDRPHPKIPKIASHLDGRRCEIAQNRSSLSKRRGDGSLGVSKSVSFAPGRLDDGGGKSRSLNASRKCLVLDKIGEDGDEKIPLLRVKAAYEKKCEELNSKGLEEEEINKEHDLLKESFTILSTEEDRRLYDWSLARSGQPERYVWPFEVDPMELAPDPPKEPEDEFPTMLVGYFFLAWFILSVTLSVTLNR